MFRSMTFWRMASRTQSWQAAKGQSSAFVQVLALKFLWLVFFAGTKQRKETWHLVNGRSWCREIGTDRPVASMQDTQRTCRMPLRAIELSQMDTEILIYEFM